jgi:L-ribulose-5-phosphate 3-epimerase
MAKINRDKIGFIQGRLSPLIDNKIQCFPWKYWQDEFVLAQQCRLALMEWTLDQENLYQNPLMTVDGQAEIRKLMKQFELTIPSLTGDCFMQAPFYKTKDKLQKNQLMQDFINIIKACAAIGISYIVMPLVDNGKLENSEQEATLIRGLKELRPFLIKYRVKIAFESDFSPALLQQFIEQLDNEWFGINYDIGNSAALGYNPAEEIALYGERITNVHVKDRLLHGGTVPLGEGAADFPAVFKKLREINYTGNYILQTARANNDDHVGVLGKYREMVESWICS